MNGLRSLQIGPTLSQFAVDDAPDDDSTKLNHRSRARIGALPSVSHNYLVALSNDVLNGYPKIRVPHERRPQIIFWTGWSRRGSGRVAPVLTIILSEIAVGYFQLLLVNEFFKVASNKCLIFLD